jgi:transcriptional regulator with GAF, ATPase, and Fis domain
VLSDLKDQEKELIVAALKRARGKTCGNKGAAALLGFRPTTLATKLNRLGLRRTDFMNG